MNHEKSTNSNLGYSAGFSAGFGYSSGWVFGWLLMRLCCLIPRCVLALASLFCITAAKGESTPIEQVLHKGEVIDIHNENGDLRIEAIDDTKRFYRWKDGSIKRRLMPRKERWYGSLGLYSAGDNWFFGKRLLVNEAWRNFQNKQELMDWLSEPWRVRNMKYVWTNTGLVAGWCEIPSRNQILVDLWQVYIDGKKPVELSGARDNAIIKTSPTTSGVAAKAVTKTDERKTQVHQAIQTGSAGTLEEQWP